LSVYGLHRLVEYLSNESSAIVSLGTCDYPRSLRDMRQRVGIQMRSDNFLVSDYHMRVAYVRHTHVARFRKREMCDGRISDLRDVLQ